LGVTVVNGALILMTVGRSNLCNRTLPRWWRKKEEEKKVKAIERAERACPLTVIKLGIFLDEVMMAH
jgi:hypothetical protein